MRKRNVHIQFWLNRKEAEALDKKVRRSGLSREAYLRHLIDGVVPRTLRPRTIFP
ncbi:MAG: ribbon-helix-helix protein, CopG family [Anaerosacchariphilus sp.]